MKPVVKWVGGKRQLLSQISEKIPKKYSTYVEPFFGGGALFFSMQPENAIINDYNQSLMNVYVQIKNNLSELIKNLEQLNAEYVDLAYYIKNREEFNKQKTLKQFDAKHAAYFMWLNKHSFNGVYRENSKGLYNVPFNKKEGYFNAIDVNNLTDIHNMFNSNNVNIMAGDYEDACKNLPDNSFVYLDPPYVPETLTANFTSYTKAGFSYIDHVTVSKLFRALVEQGHTVLLSNSNTELVHLLYGDFDISIVDARRSINRDKTGRAGKEVLVLGSNRYGN
jgi:DNA adenine methylase